VCCLADSFDVVVFDYKAVVGNEVVDDGEIVAVGGELFGADGRR